VAIQTYKQSATYIMANRRNGTLYAGVTSNLIACDYQHKQCHGDGFSKKYGCTLLVWFKCTKQWNLLFCVRNKFSRGRVSVN